MKYFFAILILILAARIPAQPKDDALVDAPAQAVETVKADYADENFAKVRADVAILEESKADGPLIDKARILAANSYIREGDLAASFEAHREFIVKHPDSPEIAFAYFGVARALTDLVHTTDTERAERKAEALENYRTFLDLTRGELRPDEDGRKMLSWRIYAYGELEDLDAYDTEAQIYLNRFDRATDAHWWMVWVGQVQAKTHKAEPDWAGARAMLESIATEKSFGNESAMPASTLRAFAKQELRFIAERE